MEFEDLMSIAERNIRQGKKQIKSFVPPPFSATSKPKPQNTTEKKLSEGVRKFLEKKKEEERQEAEKKRLEKERLLQLRSQDKKANRRVNAMLRMTKSASKACMVDAQDCFSDALAEQGEIQPDEDDYGYVSEYAQNFQKKLMEKYRSLPVASPFSSKPNLAPAAVPHAMASKSKSKDANDERPVQQPSHSFKEPEAPESTKKKKRPPPEAMNFQAMLELAAKKSQEPIPFLKPKVPGASEKETFEFGRPMTAKEKAAFLKEKACIERANAKFSGNGSTGTASSSSTTVPTDASNSKPSFKIPSLKKKEPPKSAPPPQPSPSSNKVKSSQDLPSSSKKVSAGPEVSSAKPSSNQRPIAVPSSRMQANSSSSQKKPPVFGSSKQVSSERAKVDKAPTRTPDPKPSSSALTSSEKLRQAQYAERKELSKPRPAQPPPPQSRDVNRMTERPQQKSSSSKPQAHRRLSPPRSSKFPPQPGQQKQRPMKRPNVIDSDEDYDSEMDDFIDDDDEPINYSDMIRAITGYDRNRYKDVDEDDIQESSVFEQWKEESRSARIGRLEDLEDMRMEQEELKRKAQMRKKMRR